MQSHLQSSDLPGIVCDNWSIRRPTSSLAVCRHLVQNGLLDMQSTAASVVGAAAPPANRSHGRAGRPRPRALRALSLAQASAPTRSAQQPRGARRSRVVSCPSAGDVESAAPATPVIRVPMGPEETAQQAMAACLRAHKDGVLRQRVELLLPLIGATDLDDWPGGIQQQFKAVLPMVESILKGLKAEEGLAGSLEAQIIDQGDAVGQWKGSKLGAVVFPTAQTLKNVRSLAEEGSRLVMMVNPQWQSGQVISDFGIGPWRKSAEDFVATFDEVYHLTQTRVTGDEVRILRSYPGKWQVHAVDASGDIPCIAIEDQKPSYARLEELLKAVPGSNSSKPWDERLRAELQFNQDSLKPPQ